MPYSLLKVREVQGEFNRSLSDRAPPHCLKGTGSVRRVTIVWQWQKDFQCFLEGSGQHVMATLEILGWATLWLQRALCKFKSRASEVSKTLSEGRVSHQVLVVSSLEPRVFLTGDPER